MIFKKISLVGTVLMSTTVYSGVKKTIIFKEHYTPENCVSQSICDLKKFGIVVSDVELTGNFDTSYSTQAYMYYETERVQDVQKYGVVQFIKGCKWQSNDNGEIYFNIVRDFFDGRVKFIHKEYVIDSIDKDPLYNSWAVTKSHHTRHDLYRTNSVLNSFSESTEKYYYQLFDKMKYPILYTRDTPGFSSYSPQFGTAQNMSLVFKVCLYKMNDIPVSTSPDGMSPENALKCFDWASSHVFNHQLKKFESHDQVDQICNQN